MEAPTGLRCWLITDAVEDHGSFQVQWIYGLVLRAALSSVDQEKLKHILKASRIVQHFGENVDDFYGFFQTLPHSTLSKASHNRDGFLVAPRSGCVSPWASKAMDILAHIGLLSSSAVDAVHPPIVSIERYKGCRGDLRTLHPQIHRSVWDPLVETVIADPDQFLSWALPQKKGILKQYDLSLSDGLERLAEINRHSMLGLSASECAYWVGFCQSSGHCTTDAELMMFAQVNSEHCRHKIFKSPWVINEKVQEKSLFDWIKQTHQIHPEGVLLAYHDNAAIVEQGPADSVWPDANRTYKAHLEAAHMVIKVETHNHPTAIAPFAGAATGAGGEIRDEGATGRGARSKAGLVGFSVSHLCIPGSEQPWEMDVPPPQSMQSALTIMQEAPLGSARFNNEFGRPTICGYFRSFLVPKNAQEYYGYHKPIMLAGGLGHIRPQNLWKQDLPVGSLVMVLGGPALLIGLGGGSASSSSANGVGQDLDFASTQRDNPEMQRRAQEVINRCWQSSPNPILSIHDVGAGGLANAIPELVDGAGRGCIVYLDQIPRLDPALSPMELWANESQERYVLVIEASEASRFRDYCARECCPYAVLGHVTAERHLKVLDAADGADSTDSASCVVDVPLPVLLGDLPLSPRIIDLIDVMDVPDGSADLMNPLADWTLERDQDWVDWQAIALNVLAHPNVGSKEYLITIGDRSVGGCVFRDQMVGPQQVPVADVGVTLSDFIGYQGEAMALGERAPLALRDAAASARISVGEAITNIIASPVEHLSDIKLSANWMVAAQADQQALGLYRAVQALGADFCTRLGVCIPVGKDSMSMLAQFELRSAGGSQRVTVASPVSVIISAFAKVPDVRQIWTPQLCSMSAAAVGGPTEIWLIDLTKGGAPAWTLDLTIAATVCMKTAPQSNSDSDPDDLIRAFACLKALRARQLVLAYHDRSEGGLWATLCEMAFAGAVGLEIDLDVLGSTVWDQMLGLLHEALGCVIQIRSQDRPVLEEILAVQGLEDRAYCVARVLDQGVHQDQIRWYSHQQIVFERDRFTLQEQWSCVSDEMRRLRENPETAAQARLEIRVQSARLVPRVVSRDFLNFKSPSQEVSCGRVKQPQPKVAILREQGTNGYLEMAAAWMAVGFTCVDVHMSDILSGVDDLTGYRGLAVCGGFSYGDVLGAGRGWALRILYQARLNRIFRDFFSRSDTFTLGVCNGCQMLSVLKTLIPGARHWPWFLQNRSRQFEARLSQVVITESPSILLQGLAGSVLPIVVSHGEGRVEWGPSPQGTPIAQTAALGCLRFVDSQGSATERYPANPNGSPGGLTGFTTADGRATIMMPHPERVFRSAQLSWHPREWGEYSPWIQLFANARAWVG